LSGAQLSPPGGVQQWTFTDSEPANKIYAGIAGNGSIFTKGNGPAPQGLQVGFISGKSSISQTVSLAKGTYSLSLLVAQSWRNESPETLEVFVDTNQVGNIKPSGTKYEPFVIPFTVGAGAHLITLKGAAVAGSTVLIDALAFQTASPLTGVQKPTHPVTVQFLAPPVGGSARSPLAPVLVDVFNRFGVSWRGLNVSVILIRVGKGPHGHLVRGSVVHAKATNGIAIFRRLIISAPGQYILRARVGRQHVDSPVFDIGLALPH
jgi:hypothetical protein